MTGITWLIDGYNLLGALGLIQGDLGQGGLERGRVQLLDFLAEHFGSQNPQVLVVFDGRERSRRRPAEQEHRGIQVRFARGEADDLIEELLREHGASSQLTLVSSDHRLHRAAKRRHVRVIDSEAFLEAAEKRAGVGPSLPSPANPEGTKPEATGDAAHWLREFSDVEKEPGLDDLLDGAV